MKKKIILMSCASLLAGSIVNVDYGEAKSSRINNTLEEENNDEQNQPEREEGDEDNSSGDSNDTTVPPEQSDSSTDSDSNTNSGTSTQKPSKPSTNPSNEQEKIDEIKENLNQIENNKEQIESEISSIQQYITETEKQLSEIRDKIAKTESLINEIESSIKENEGKLVELEEKIEKKTVELEKQKVRLGQTLSFLYEYRNFGFFQFFFQTENLSELLTMVDFITLIMDENNTIYEKIVIQEKELQEEKKELKNTMKQLEEEKSILEELKTQQLAEKAVQDELLAEHLEKEIEAFERLEAEERAETALNNEMKEILTNLSNSIGNVNINGKMASPMKAGTYTITSTFGYRTHPVYGTQKLHNGIDMAGNCGTPIYSMADGVVTTSGPASGYGNWIVIFHEKFGLFSIYGHMYSDGVFVQPGQVVKQGQLIGEVGNSGISTGCHLHLSVADSYNGSTFTYIDPLSVIE